MSLDLNPLRRAQPKERVRRPGWGWAVVLLALLLAGGGLTWVGGASGLLSKLRPKPAARLDLARVDQGDIEVRVIEFGSIETGEGAVVRAKVEALIGLVGGTQQGQPGAQGQGNAQQKGANAQQGQQGQSGQQPQGGASATPKKKTSVGRAKTKLGSATSTPAAGTSSGGAARPGMTSRTDSSSGDASSAGGGGVQTNASASGSGSGASGGTGASQAGGASTQVAMSDVTAKPAIRSFSYVVTPYMPLRPVKAAAQSVQKQAQGAQPGGRGGRGGGNGDLNQQKPGATTIISILPEGTRVKAGQVVCEFDSSSFHDEYTAQKIKYEQAKAWVDQAQTLLEVNKITFREFEEGIYPQDEQLIRQYIATCRVEYERAKDNLDWSIQVTKKGFRAVEQLKADQSGLQRAEIALQIAEEMARRLKIYTGPRIKTALRAKIAANESDLLTQKAAFEIESQRLRKLGQMIEYCTLRAPVDGMVIYVKKSNGWGRTEDQIQEGATVREGQPIFEMPDRKHMRVKVRLNESKVSLLHPGLKARITVDAFPDRPLFGTVAEVTAIPTPINGPFSDVRVYFAMVDIIADESADLRPGLSAEVEFKVDTKHDVTRVPAHAVRWIEGKPHVAIPAGYNDRGVPSWTWRHITLGESDDSFVQVLSGLKPGEEVALEPNLLPLPKLETIANATATADQAL